MEISQNEDAAFEWERCNGIWLGINAGVSEAMSAKMREWVNEIPQGITAKMSAALCCVMCVKRMGAYFPASHAGVEGIWQLPGCFYDKCWKDRDGKWNAAVCMSEQWWPHGGSAWRSYAIEPPYAFRHETGHAFAFLNRPRASFSEPFKTIALSERAEAIAHLSAADRHLLDYFLEKHWTKGVEEIFAESYAAHFGKLAPGPSGEWEPLFRSTFARSIAQVSAMIEAAK